MPAEEIAPGAEYGTEIIAPSLCQIRQCRHQVEHGAYDGHDGTLYGRSTLVEHRQVIAMVVEHLGRGIGRQRPAAEVVDRTPGHDPHAVTRELHAPAEVDLLHVGEEIVVEAP